MKRLEDKVAVVTGGASGIGFVVAAALADEGAQVYLAGRNGDRGQAAAKKLTDAGGRATFVPTDVTKDDQVGHLAEQAASERGRIDIWFNNAGFEGPLGPLEEADDGLVLQTLETNVKGVYSGMGWAIKHMPEGGLIVNNASFVGVYAPVPIGIAYGGSKAAVVSMTKAAAMALGERGIDVLCICPGIVDTPMVDRLTGGAGIEARQGFAAQLAPSGQLSQPEAVAEVVLELCTRSREYPSGSILLVDAGPTVSLI